MIKTAGHILKDSEVNLEGRLHLDLLQDRTGPATKQNIPLASPQVVIVEKQPEFTVIEVTCSCGSKLQLKCEYASDNPPEAQQIEQNINGENNNET